jgi:uncharacterized protein (TIGR03083 family)
MTEATITDGAVSGAYRGTRLRLTELLSNSGAATGEAAVLTCPDWTVRDVVAHLSGCMVDAINGRLEGAGTDPWTARQVDERRGWALGAILDEWNEAAPMVEPMLDTAGDIGRQAVADAVSHEHDIRLALALPGARDSDAVRVGLTFVAKQLVDEAAARREALHIVSDGLTWGPADAPVRVAGPAFEMLRAITGRRSISQIRALAWEGDSWRVIPAFWWHSISPSPIDIHE